MHKMNEDVKVSVLLPVYNAKKYLKECLDSVWSQSLKEIEIICIDDGSTDGSSEILDEAALRDERVKVIHKENKGYGHAMNRGLAHARGKYIAFLEADDFITAEMYSDLYQLADKHRLDFVKSDFSFLEGDPGDYHETPVPIWWEKERYGRVLEAGEKDFLFKGWIAHWSAIYRKDFLTENNICYNETPGASYQDVGFWFQTIACADRIFLTDGNYYRYRQDNPASSMKDRKKVYCVTDEYDFILKKLQEKGIFRQYLPQYTALRFIGHKDALIRMADEYRIEFVQFIHRMSANFSDLKRQGLLDLSFMDASDAKALELLLEDPDAYYDNFFFAEKYIRKKTRDKRRIFIYGAGGKAGRLLRRIADEDKKRLTGFLITKKEKLEDQLYGKPIFQIDEVALTDEDAVIVGVTERYKEEIFAILRERGIRNVIDIPDSKV